MKFAMPILLSFLSCAGGAGAAEVPGTLFERVGARLESATLSNSVLLIVDAQREYVDGALPLAGVDAAIAETERLLTRARKSGTPVIHIVHKGKGPLFNPAGPFFDIVAPLHALAGETVIEKRA